jgi:SAM-dependent methyltransferase
MSPLANINMSYRVGECLCCGFSFAFELPSEVTYQNYYSELSKYDTAIKASEFDCLRFDEIANLCAQNLSKNATIIDIGCGEGALLSRLYKIGFTKIYGIEPAPNAAIVAKEKYGINSISKGFFTDSFSAVPISTADCICFSAVLEHLPNLRNDLQKFLTVLNPSCKVIIEVPAIELFSSDTAEPSGAFSIEHINFFSRDPLTNLMKSLGWHCVHSQYLEYTLFQTGSVISIFEISPKKSGGWLRSNYSLERYILTCGSLLVDVLNKIPEEDFIIYGAGSHSARLLPNITDNKKSIKAIVDKNPNLIGKTLGPWSIEAPNIIDAMPSLPIVISSFRSQGEISANLRKNHPNPLILLY